MRTAIGIDYGTTSCCVAVFRHKRVETILNNMGKPTTPSYVAFTDEERLVGDTARNQAVMNLTNTVFGVKRMIGRKFSDPILQQDMQRWPFKVIRGDADRPQIEVE
jgi:L1 cell adhesion molecule like protein